MLILFVALATETDRYLILLAIVLALVFSYSAFIFQMLTYDGTNSALMVGIVTLGFGGWFPAASIIAFFISSYLISVVFTTLVGSTSLAHLSERRNGIQVWSNGFWFCLFILLHFIFMADVFIVGAFGALAAATADTWATETGSRFKSSKTWLITDFRLVKPGDDGGISLPGSMAALAGAALMAMLAAVGLAGYPYLVAIAVLFGGLLGCMADSYAGAAYQYQKKPFPFFGKTRVSNDLINVVGTSVGTLVSIVLYYTLTYALV